MSQTHAYTPRIRYEPAQSVKPIPRVEETRVALHDFLIRQHEPDCTDAPDCECRAVWVEQREVHKFLRARGMTYTGARAEVRRCIDLGLVERREAEAPGALRHARDRLFQVRAVPPRGLTP